MDKDYENFVGRMGSSEEIIELDDVQEKDLEHSGKDLEHSGKEYVNSLLHSMGDTIMFDF